MKMKLDKCLECGADLVKEARDIAYTYKGKGNVIKDVKGTYCLKCDFSIIDKKDIDRVDQEMQSFREMVNSELVDPKFIKEVREKLNLGRTEAGQVFGGGKNIFNQYETGKTTPPKPLVMLFKVLNNHPDLLKEIRG